jgi:REP element-mobilizing transposase RayT
MPRNSRIDIPGLLQHVIVRGIEKRPVFLDDQDREEFLSRFSLLLKETSTDCYAWALLDSHFHLLLQPQIVKLAHFMRRLLTGYAVVFNLRHGRAGHLFQNRYKSIVCDSDSYLLELVRYIHLNPVRAGIVTGLEDLAGYPWCGHGELLGKRSRTLISEDGVLSHFAQGRTTARKRYAQFIADGIATPAKVKLSAGGKRTSQALDPGLGNDVLYDDRILGGGCFVEQVLNTAEIDTDAPALSMADLMEQVAEYFQLERTRLSKPSKERKLAQAKAVICYMALRELGLRGIDVSAELACTPAAVSHAAKRGEAVIREEEGLRERFGVKL